MTQVRLRLRISPKYRQEPILSRLIAGYGLVVNITGANLGKDANPGWLDLELRGSAQRISQGIHYLRSLQLEVIGKPNPCGDSWNY
jgi:hypothetical protein